MIIEQIKEYLLASILLAPVIKVVVDIIKNFTEDLGETIPRLYFYISVATGIGLGALFLPTQGFTLVEGIIIGVVAGTIPAPILHDLLEIIREAKYRLRIIRFEVEAELDNNEGDLTE